MVNDVLLALCLATTAAVLFVVLLLLKKLRGDKSGALEAAIREEFRTSRQESTHQARELREEIGNAQAKANESLAQNLKTAAEAQKQDLTALRATTEEKLESVRKTTEEKLAAGERVQRQAVADLQEAMTKLTETTRTAMASQREQVQTQLTEIQKANEARFEKVQNTVVEQLKTLAASAREDQQKSREALDQKLTQIQENNEKKLEQMRQTVDEKLQSTIEKRLGESFKLVSTQLEAVQRGLGEMQNLANGVGDLKRVLTNVKERGTWGEYQLEAILEQILTPDQYAKNVTTKPGGGQVEFAIKMPGRSADPSIPVWLPIDAKFPKEDYERLLDAVNRADTELVKSATKALATAIQRAAKDIHDKYIEPPDTTDFGIMFLPTEGLYAEVLRQPGLHDEIQRKYRVIVAGPTILAALLNSLRVGFQTLVIEKRAHEVWTVLGAIKTEFGKFGGVLAKLKRQVGAVSNTIDDSQTRTRVMQSKLRSVEALPAEEAEATLALPENVEIAAEEEAEAEEDNAQEPEPVPAMEDDDSLPF